MAFSTTFKPLYQNQLVSFTLCKTPSNLSTFHLPDVFLTFSPTKHSLPRTFSPLFLEVRAHVTHLETTTTTTNSSSTEEESSKPTINGDRDKGEEGKEFVGNNGSSDIGKRVVKFKDKHGNGRNGRFGSKRRELGGTGYSSLRSKDENFVKSKLKSEGGNDFLGKMDKGFKKDESIDHLGMEKKGKRPKKGKVESPGAVLRVGLDRCSKRGDVMNAIRLYDLAKREGIKLGQYHYAVILYLCSSAATGVIQPAKSGSGSRSLGKVESSNDSSEADSDSSRGRELEKDGSQPAVNNGSSYTSFRESSNLNQLYNEDTDTGFQSIDGLIRLINGDDQSSRMERVNVDLENHGIRVDEDVREYAIKRGFEIFEEMVLEKVPMNEAILTSLARIAMSMGNGDMAFSMVMQMKDLGINPRLRSYGPALSVFCDTGDVEKAFIVEEHMLAHGVYPEEPELEALLRVSIEANRSDKVYYLLHKLRTSVRKVLPSTADLIEKWFKSKAASRIGKRKWDQKLLREAIENGGGGWHGQGWLGKGKWTVLRSFVGADALCSCCGEKLVTIDLDPTETENFAESVARIAKEREKNSSFQKFQKWLDYYGPFEAVVDAANVGLFSQRKFRPSKVNTIVNGIRKMLPSKKWPLIVLHNRRITGDKMDEGINKTLIEKWRNADALYATPTGSNDDWYWLYAAIKFRCLIVTNDEMRDHLFQLLGNDFFPKWKERHQVRFNFSDTGPVFHLPPPCSVVIQESEKGHWHIPIISEKDNEEERTWLCITRNQADKGGQEAITLDEEARFSPCEKGNQTSDFETEAHRIPPILKKVGNHENPGKPPEISRNLRDTCSSSLLVDQVAILPKIEAAEKLGGCVIDFQI